MIERIALKPCPSGHTKATRDNNNIYGSWWVKCAECSWRTAGSTEAEAIAAWNNRATELSAGDGVQQCDRDAADAMLKSADLVTLDRYEQSIAQAFARHRSTAAAAERAKIVAWLLKDSTRLDYEAIPELERESPFWWAADAIERGEV